MSDRRPTKHHALEKLVSMEVPVGTVIDVGILTGTQDLIASFPRVHHLLIEPIVEWNDVIIRNYRNSGIDFELLNVAASDSNTLMMMETSTISPGRPITHARLTDKTAGANLREVDVRTLDKIIEDRPHLKRPFLLKLDVDGIEMKILEGSRSILQDCSVVVIEAPLGNLLSRSNWLINCGFRIFDIVDICYYDNQLWQVDLVFVNEKMMQKYGISIHNPPSDMSKWKPFS